MEETLSLIYHGCKLARNLEQNLPTLSNQSTTLLNYCDEIAKVFKIATDGLNNNPTFSLNPTVVEAEVVVPLTQASNEFDNIAVQEWLRSSYAQVIEHAQAQSSNDQNSMVNASSGFNTFEFGGMVRTHSTELLHMGEGSSGSVTQRARKRKDGQEQRTVRVGTPRMGNPEIPPDDGFTWRKYGQKEILGSTFPRGYFRCTHKTFYGCDAKKQVQRLDDDPTMFEVTYYGNHTCHMSQTAPAPTPSAAPPTVSTIVHQEHNPDAPSHPSSLPLYRWLSMDMGGGGVSGQEDTMPQTDLQLQMYTDFNQPSGSGVLHSTVAAGLSNSRDADYPVLDLADVMFNSGGSSNSMDSIFPFSMHNNS